MSTEHESIPSELDSDSGLPIGPRLGNPEPARRPERVVLRGRYARLDPLDPACHGDNLYAASTPSNRKALFRYLPEPSPDSRRSFDVWLANAATSADPLFFAVTDLATGRAEGRQSLMRIVPEHQTIEIGHIYWGPRIARSRVATEAAFLFARYAFETLGYRRLEWKCDALNAPSRRSAMRFGFTYEGLFRRAMIVRGRSRDTAWFAMIGEEWPVLRAAYERWLAPTNFDAQGRHKSRLSQLTSAALSARRGSC